jgi:hypothetical protein
VFVDVRLLARGLLILFCLDGDDLKHLQGYMSENENPALWGINEVCCVCCCPMFGV